MNRPRTAALIALTAAAAGCATQPTAQPAAAPIPSPTPTVCQQTNLTGIETELKSHPTLRVPAAAATATTSKLRPWVRSTDPKSFIAHVTAAELTAAGIDTSELAQNTKVILVVNHGSFDRRSLPIGGGAPAQPQPADTRPISWLLYVLDPHTGQPIIWQAAEDSPCFLG